MNAKEMLEKLGYNLFENIWHKNLITYIKTPIEVEVEFDLIDKTYSVGKNEYDYFANYNIDIEMHIAITQQMKELGWLDD